MKGLQTSSASQGAVKSITIKKVFLTGCKICLMHNKKSSLRDAKGNVNYAVWLTVHFSSVYRFLSCTGVVSHC